jgi:hypothetical protein
VLYCPQCGAEYREGYSSCSDCHVLLTRDRPRAKCHETTQPDQNEPKQDPFTDFWRGEDPRIHAEICSLLDEVEIPHMTIRREDHLFNLTRQPQLQIAIPFSSLEKAEKVIAEAFGEPLELPAPESESIEGENESLNGWSKFLRASADRGLLPAILEKMREPREAKSDNVAKPEPELEKGTELRRQDSVEWFPGDATQEVWSGQEPELAEMISASLHENDIHSRTDEFKNLHLVFVQPKDEPRAREIIREITESTSSE